MHFDQINIGTGADTLIGGGDSDLLEGTGRDKVRDFEQETDLIDVHAFGLSGFGDLNMSQTGNHVRINFGDWDVALICNTDLIDMDTGDFIFLNAPLSRKMAKPRRARASEVFMCFRHKLAQIDLRARLSIADPRFDRLVVRMPAVGAT